MCYLSLYLLSRLFMLLLLIQLSLLFQQLAISINFVISVICYLLCHEKLYVVHRIKIKQNYIMKNWGKWGNHVDRTYPFIQAILKYEKDSYKIADVMHFAPFMHQITYISTICSLPFIFYNSRLCFISIYSD